MKKFFILLGLFLLLPCFISNVYAKDFSENGTVLFRLETKTPLSVTSTGANFLADLKKVQSSASDPTRKGFFYTKKTPQNQKFLDSSTRLTPTNRTFGAVVQNLTCDTEYEALPFFEYTSTTTTTTILFYGDLVSFTTKSCADQVRVSEITVKGLEKDRVTLTVTVENNSPYDTTNSIEITTGSEAFKKVAPVFIASIGKTSTEIIPITALTPDTNYLYRVVTTFIRPPVQPGTTDTRPPLPPDVYSLVRSFTTIKVDGTGGGEGGVEDVTTPFTITTKGGTVSGNEITVSGEFTTTNPYTSTKVQTWFRFKIKNQTTWVVSAYSGKESTLSKNIPSHLFKGIAPGSTDCDQLGATINLTKIPESKIVFGNTKEITLGDKTYEYQAVGQYLSVLKSNAAYFCDEDAGPSTIGGEDVGGAEDPRNNTYTFLTPLPLGEGLESQDSVEIGAGGGGILGILQRIFTIMLVAAVVLAVVFMIIGGARYATGDTLGGKMGGKEIITNAVKGLLFALLAWLLLNIVNPDLLRFTLSIPNIGQPLTPGTGNKTPTTGVGSTIPGEGCGPGVSDKGCFDLIAADEARVRKIFTDAGFTFNANPCVSPDPNVSGCTNVGKLSPTTINALLTVKRECNCAIVITGGTEYWLHGAGGNHKKFTAVDLRLNNAPFDNFIKSKEKVADPYKICRETYSYKGLRFCNESGSHWHVETLSSTEGGPGSGNIGDPKPGQLFTFPRINIQGYVVSGTGSVYTETQLTAKVNAQAMKDLRPQITAAASREGIGSKLFYALVAQESTGDPQAGSGAGACGVAQLLPDTARPLDPSLAGLSDSAVCTTLKNNVDLSLRVGAKYLKEGFQIGGGGNKNALAYYNGGPAAVANSNDCPGRKAYECPWDAPGYYDRTKPSGPPLKSLEKQGDINTGFSETRFYVINILNMEAI